MELFIATIASYRIIIPKPKKSSLAKLGLIQAYLLAFTSKM